MNDLSFASQELDFIYYLIEKKRLTLPMAKELRNVLDAYILEYQSSAVNQINQEPFIVTEAILPESSIGKVEIKKTQTPLPSNDNKVDKQENQVLAKEVSGELEYLVATGAISPDDMAKFKNFF